MSRASWTTLGLVCALGLCTLLATRARHEVEAAKLELHDSVELLLFPSGRFLQELSMGHRHLLADGAWLTAIQYYGKHHMSDGHYPLAPHLFTVLTDADPQFVNAYLFGALVMAEDGRLGEAERLLEQGVARNPQAWRLGFELGFFRYVYRKAWVPAAEAFARAAREPAAPEYVARFAAAAYERGGELSTAALLWETIARTSGNEEIRRMARERLARLDAGEQS